MKLLNKYKDIFIIFFIVRIVYLIIELFLQSVFPNITPLFQMMDCENYITIAKNGYIENKLYAFFPLIPILIKIFGVYGCIIINNISVLLSSIMLEKIWNKNAAILFLLSPIQIYCFIPYTESIFILLTLLCYYFYKNNKYLLLGLVLGLGVSCRSITSILFFILFIFMIIKKEKFKNILLTYVPATIISCLYPIYLQIKTNHWDTFITVQYEYWDAEKSNLFRTIYLDIKYFLENDFYEKYLVSLTYIFLFLLILALLKFKNLDNELILYSIISIFVIFSVCKISYINSTCNPSTSYFRYILACFPIYIGLSFYNQKLIRFIFIILHILIATNFILNGWPF